MESRLDASFYNELIKGCIVKKSFFSLVNNHLKPSFLPEGAYRVLWGEITGFERKYDKIPSFGVLRQRLADSTEDAAEGALELLADIKDIIKVDYDSVLKEFEGFVKKSMFLAAYKDLAELYNKGKKDAAYTKFKEVGDTLNAFSLQAESGELVFGNFSGRHVDRILENSGNLHKQMYWPMGIDLLDHYMDGGTYRGEITLLLGNSGVGKSQALIHSGISTARRGGRVVHIQAEGTKRQVMDRYDAAWTGTLYKDMKRANIPDEKFKALQKVVRKVGKGEIHVFCKQKFGAFTVPEIRNIVWEVIRKYGVVDKIIVDYLELIEPGDGIIYRASEERQRQTKLSRAFKDLAVETDSALDTATQATVEAPETKENPDYVMTEWNLSEDKGKIRAFDNFISMNQTRDEKQEGIIRLYGGKFRENQSGQIIKIATALHRARFYDRIKTINELYGMEELSVLKQ